MPLFVAIVICNFLVQIYQSHVSEKPTTEAHQKGNKKHAQNANYLLNFSYPSAREQIAADRKAREQELRHKQRKRADYVPYRRERFLQAKYAVVLYQLLMNMINTCHLQLSLRGFSEIRRRFQRKFNGPRCSCRLASRGGGSRAIPCAD